MTTPANALFEVWLLARAATRAIDEAVDGSGLDADEFAVYSVLAAGPQRPVALAAHLSAPLTTVSSYVRRFERRGHVRREPNPADGRSYLITLTPDGHAAHQDAGRRFRPLLAAVETTLGPDEPAVRAALTRLREALSSAGSDRA